MGGYRSPMRSCSASCWPQRMLRVTKGRCCAWLERFTNERLPPLAEVALAASALEELRHGRRNLGMETLKRMLGR